MKCKFAFIVSCIASILLAASCSRPAKSVAPAPEDLVSFTSVKSNDTSSFMLSNGEHCQELVEVSATFPKFYKDEATTLKLQKLYIKKVLEGNDSLPVEQAVQQYASALLHQNFIDGSDGENEIESNGEKAIANKFLFSVNITVAYHQNGIVTLCKEETVKKNNVASKTHQYYNLDLNTMSLIDLSIFKDEAIDDICQLLKNKLMKQNNAKNSDELNDLGFFNIDNLTVTTNFCFDENGITWSYLPQELAADANLEPKITLDYGTLKAFASENSVLKQF